MPPRIPAAPRVLTFAPPKLIQIEPAELFLRGFARVEWAEEVGGDNKGRWVKRVLATVGLPEGNPWCAAVVYDVGSGMLADQWTLPRTASCDVLLEHARSRGILVDKPMRGDVFLLMRNEHDAIHTGAVTALLDGGASFNTIEGNTNNDGSANGYCVLRRHRGGADDRVLSRGYYYRFIRWHAPVGATT